MINPQKVKTVQTEEQESFYNYSKKILLWVIHNIKFLFIPGYNLEELTYRRTKYEMDFPRKNHIKRYKSPLFIIGVISIFIFFTLSIFPHWISPYTYLEATDYTGLNIYMENYFPPSPEHPLGQTFRGFDVLARIIFGARPVFIFSLTATLIASLIGIFIGAISAYYGKWLDTILMRLMDIILSFPGVVFAVLFLLIFGSDFIFLIVTYSIIGIPFFARLIRTKMIKEKELPYIAAAKVVGAKKFRIIFRHMLPNCTQSYIVAASLNIARNIISLAVLGFLRIGNIGWIEWGYDISVALPYFYIAVWAVFYPALMIVISSMGFLLVGDGLAEDDVISAEGLD